LLVGSLKNAKGKMMVINMCLLLSDQLVEAWDIICRIDASVVISNVPILFRDLSSYMFNFVTIIVGYADLVRSL
jgi:hypothetical protein